MVVAGLWAGARVQILGSGVAVRSWRIKISEAGGVTAGGPVLGHEAPQAAPRSVLRFLGAVARERTRCCAKLLLARTRTLLNERKKQLRKQHV